MTKLITQLKLFLKASFSLKMRNEVYNVIWIERKPGIEIFVRTFKGNKLDDVEDIVQEIMLKVYKNLHTYNPVYSFNTWIYSIARNHCVNNLKIKTPNIISLNSDDTNKFDVRGNSLSDDKIIARQTEEIIDKCISEFNPQERQISFLRFYERLSIKAISKIMEMPAGTVKYKIHVIKNKIKTELDKKNEIAI